MIWVPFGESQVKRVLLTQVKAPAIAECHQENCSGNRISPGRFPRVSSLPLQFPLDRPAGPFKLNLRLPLFLQIRQFERVAIGAKNDASSGFGQCHLLDGIVDLSHANAVDNDCRLGGRITHKFSKVLRRFVADSFDYVSVPP
jgi:hypothetical protein